MDCCSAAKPSFFWEENYCSLGSLATQSERPDSGPEEQVPKCVVKERTLYVFTEVKICFPFGTGPSWSPLLSIREYQYMKSSSSLRPLSTLTCLPLQLLVAQGREGGVTGLIKLLLPGCLHHSWREGHEQALGENLITTH